MPVVKNDETIQRRYYSRTADRYESMHCTEDGPHFLALAFLLGVLDYLKVRSLLDIGSGTGRAIRYLKQRRPELRVVGVEPVRELREIGYAGGLTEDELLAGDATNLRFGARDFDLVSGFGVLHHIRNPELAVAEMLRVADKAVFISDSNNFGQGPPAIRFLKQIIDRLGLWKTAVFLRTGGRGYFFSEGDGLSYSYSVFNNYRQIRAQCRKTHLLSTGGSGVNLYKTATHIALLGIKGL